MHFPHVLRRLAAAVVVPALALIGVIGISPTAAASSDSLTVSIEIIKENNIKVKIAFSSSSISRSSCEDASSLDSLDSDVKEKLKTDYDSKSDTCTVTANNISMSQYNRHFPGEIDHEGKEFTYTSSDSAFSYYDSAEVSVTFPGKVSSVSGDGKKSGNTATWNNAQDETGTLTAKGADRASSHNTEDADRASSRDSEDNDTNSFLPIIIIIVLVLVTIGGVATFIIIRQKRAKTSIAPGYPQPGQQPYNPQQPYNSQLGYGQPGQAPAVPGTAQPGYYAQPGAQQSYSPQSDYDQPGQQPRSPDGQY